MCSLKIGTRLNYVAFLHYCFSRLQPHEKSHRLANLHVLNSAVCLFLSWLNGAFPTYLDGLSPLLHGQHCLFFYTYLCYTFINCSEYIYIASSLNFESLRTKTVCNSYSCFVYLILGLTILFDNQYCINKYIK